MEYTPVDIHPSAERSNNMSNASKAAKARYKAKAIKTFYLDLNAKTDADIIQWLEQEPNKAKAVKEACRRNIPKHMIDYNVPSSPYKYLCPACEKIYIPSETTRYGYCSCGQRIINLTEAQETENKKLIQEYIRKHETSTPVDTDAATSTPVDTDAETSTPVDTDAATSTPVDTDATTSTPVDTDAATSTPVDTDAATSTPVDTDAETSTPVDTDAATSTPVDTDATTSTPVDTDAETEASALWDDITPKPNYNVHYITKRGGKEYYRALPVVAANKKEAIRIFREIHKGTFEKAEGHAFQPIAEPITK